jgi:chitinase
MLLIRSLFATLCLSFAGLAVAAEPAKIIAYYFPSTTPGRAYAPADIPAAKLTHLNYAFANVEGGEVVIAHPELDLEMFAGLRELKQQQPHLKTLISVGGWSGSKNFSDAALTPESRARFADSGVAFMRRHGFDGIDIDWEFPVAGGMAGNIVRPDDKPNFTLLLQALRERLDAAGKADGRAYLLTAALGAAHEHIETAKVAAQLDWLNLMAYDFSGTWNARSGHVAPLFADPAAGAAGGGPQNNVAGLVDRFVGAGVNPRQIVLGVPFYGYSWKSCAAVDHGQYQACAGPGRGTWEAGALDHGDIARNLLNRNGFSRYWNAASRSPWLFNPVTGEFVSYEDSESLTHKLRYLKLRKLAGAMFWELGGDRQQALLDTLRRELVPAP